MDQERVLITTPAKIILFGEHSVVYGKTAVALSIGLQTSLFLERQSDCVLLDLPNIEVSKSWPMSDIKKLFSKLSKHSSSFELNPKTCQKTALIYDFLQISNEELRKEDVALVAFFHLYSSIIGKPLPFAIRLESRIPHGAGLGSSAAFSVSLCTAFLFLSGQLKSLQKNQMNALSEKDQQLISEWAFKSEKLFHGNPSGLDSTVCTFGGAVQLKKGQPSKIRTPNMQAILVNTRVSRSTKHQVEKVQALYNKDRAFVTELLEDMDELAETGSGCLEAMGGQTLETSEDYDTLLSLISSNHGFLQALGVSHPRLDEMVCIAQKYGLHGKLTGAGGGGFGLIIAPSHHSKIVEKCVKDLQSNGFDAWVTSLGNNGVTISQF